MLDTIQTVEIPENVEIELRIAGPVVRALAWVIDFIIRLIVYMLLILFLVNYLGRLGFGLFLIAIFLLEWFYPVFFEIYQQGATPGKKLMGIKVVNELGIPVDFAASMVRNLLRTIDFLPFLYATGLLAMLMNKDFKRIGDIAAGTFVIYEAEKLKKLILPDVQPKELPFCLTREEQQAIIHFAERSQTLHPERVTELANIIQPLVTDQQEEIKNYLFQIANGLAGRKS